MPQRSRATLNRSNYRPRERCIPIPRRSSRRRCRTYKGNRDPKVFQPYVVGFVELAEGVLVESLIIGATPGQPKIGQRLRSTTTTLETSDGKSLVTFAFRPEG